ncbi:MAG: 6,7-dimethyl-8-ribityllumazine synthase [Acidimicrobiales bacterium]
MTTYEGQLYGQGLRIGLVCGRFNRLVTDALLAGALDALRRHGVAGDDVDVAWVPGALEIPLAARTMAATGRYHALAVLGSVIRGATGHYDLVVGQCAAGVTRAQLDAGVPIVFGVLTTENLDQAMERAGSKGGNKGADAALAAVEMADLLRRLSSTRTQGAPPPPDP